MTMLRVLGIDPSLTSTGWAVVDYDGREVAYITSGRIKTFPASPMHERLYSIARGMGEVRDYTQPQCAGMEKMFSMPKLAGAGLILAMVRGAILGAWPDSIPIDYDLAPAEIKKAVALTGAASKGRMIAVTQSLLRLDAPLPEDEADAAAVAICRAIRYWRTLP